ncbi:hypothetical protein [Paenibacillus mendelii]|uniref:General stress protein 17M-like domain-containing protein n=1 Tax=Paenibacillus mendelii TaxID=206163 RepID=A0ABV6JFP4_9BACL|nr:hypothetical protein [Paenibacillus mendelii]MCQ6562561.1 hypothetical protein [Paenibacillus mendelii]
MPEKPIIVYFNSPDQANKALEKMKNEFEVIESGIDRFDGYPGEGYNPSNPLSGDIPSLGSLTLGGNFDTDSGILAAASTSASGYSSGGPGNMVSGVDIILTAIVQEENGDRAMEIAHECGAL